MTADQLKQLAGDARVAASAAHRAHRDGSLALGREARYVLAALGEAATTLAAVSDRVDTIAAEAAVDSCRGLPPSPDGRWHYWLTAVDSGGTIRAVGLATACPIATGPELAEAAHGLTPHTITPLSAPAGATPANREEHQP